MRRKESRPEDANDSERIISGDKESNKGRNELYLFSCDVVDFENVLLSTKHDNLDTFVVIGQPGITSLKGISKLVNLRELWVVECLVQVIVENNYLNIYEWLYFLFTHFSQWKYTRVIITLVNKN